MRRCLLSSFDLGLGLLWVPLRFESRETAAGGGRREPRAGLLRAQLGKWLEAWISGGASEFGARRGRICWAGPVGLPAPTGHWQSEKTVILASHCLFLFVTLSLTQILPVPPDAHFMALTSGLDLRRPTPGLALLSRGSGPAGALTCNEAT